MFSLEGHAAAESGLISTRVNLEILPDSPYAIGRFTTWALFNGRDDRGRGGAGTSKAPPPRYVEERCLNELSLEMFFCQSV